MQKTLTICVLVGLVLALAAPVYAAPSNVGEPRWHRVKFGETLYSIGRTYNVKPTAIAAANQLVDPNKIYVGQVLQIPAVPPYHRSPACGSYHVVKIGDTLSAIGRAYNLSPWTIAAANGIYNLNIIYAGEQLFIPCYY